MAVVLLGSGSANGSNPAAAAPAGSNRLLLAFFPYENNPNIDNDSATYGDQSMSAVGAQVNAGFATRAGGRWFKLDEAGIAAATGTTVTPTFASTPSNWQVHYLWFGNVDQTTPNNAQVDDAVDPGNASVDINGVVDGAIVAGAMQGNTGAPSWTGVTEETNVQSASSRGTTGVVLTSSTSAVTCSPTFSGVNRSMVAGFSLNPSAGGGETTTITPTGGIKVGGSASIHRTAEISPTGGVVVGGSAPASRTNHVIPTGGVIVGGAAPLSSAAFITPTGGIRVGGAATITRSRFITPTGGIVVGGAAALSRSVSIPPAGGIVIGGLAALAAALNIVPAGGIRVGGAPAIVRSRFVLPTGGAVIGGAAAITRALVIDPTGGIVVGGAATILGAGDPIPIVPSGGIVVGGSAEISKALTITPTGGIVVGGTAPLTGSGETIITPTGGIVVGGSGTIARSRFILPSGGIVVGGTAPLSFTAGIVVITPTGGITVGGTAPPARALSIVPSGGIEIGGAVALVATVTRTEKPVFATVSVEAIVDRFFNATCTITEAISDEEPTVGPDGTATFPTPATVYSGKCKVEPLAPRNISENGEADTLREELAVKLRAFDAATVEPGMIVIITASDDPAILNIPFEVVRHEMRTAALTRRIIVQHLESVPLPGAP